MKIIVTILIIAALGVGGWFLLSNNSDDESTNTTSVSADTNTSASLPKNMDEVVSPSYDEVEIEPTAGDQTAMEEMLYDFSTDLTDVSGGSATGTAQATWSDGSYNLIANFNNLPEPDGTDFYEGWIVNKSPLDVLSTGKAELKDGKYMNTYKSLKDLTDHDFYVLTLEPDDGDPAPAEHILEGTLVK